MTLKQVNILQIVSCYPSPWDHGHTFPPSCQGVVRSSGICRLTSLFVGIDIRIFSFLLRYPVLVFFIRDGRQVVPMQSDAVEGHFDDLKWRWQQRAVGCWTRNTLLWSQAVKQVSESQSAVNCVYKNCLTKTDIIRQKCEIGSVQMIECILYNL